MKLYFPKKEDLCVTSNDDPMLLYYNRLTKYFYRKRLSMVLDLLKGVNAKHVLEAGVGSGVLMPILSLYCKKITGIDIHEKLNEVDRFLQKEKIKAYVCRSDICRLPFLENSFDVIVSLSVLEFIEDISIAVEELYRVTVKGGVIIIGVPVLNRTTDFLYNFLGNYEHKLKHKASHNDIITQMEKRFSITKLIAFPQFVSVNRALFLAIKAVKE